MYMSNKASLLTCLQSSGVMVEKIEIDQILKPSWEKKGGRHWSPDLKHTKEREIVSKTSLKLGLFYGSDVQSRP